MHVPTPVPLRSPRESLAGYILLPRLIDKVRLLAQGQLPEAYATNVLKVWLTLDGRFLTFTGLNAEVLSWVREHARPTTAKEKHTWAEQIDRYRPDVVLVEYRTHVYPELAAQVDVGSLNVLDLIDMDEGRLPINHRTRTLRRCKARVA
jgi:Domain of unknown function (DUF5069)